MYWKELESSSQKILSQILTLTLLPGCPTSHFHSMKRGVEQDGVEDPTQISEDVLLYFLRRGAVSCCLPNI